MQNAINLLIVDDDPDSQALMRAVCNKAGFHSHRIAASGAEALRMLQEQPVDVAIVDWMMPEMDGLQLTQKIRNLDDQQGHYTAIIMTSARGDSTDLVTAIQNGANDYIRKPIDAAEFAARTLSSSRVAKLHNELLETQQRILSAAEQLEELAETDPLTGIANRRRLEGRLERDLERVRHHGGTLCCCMLDIDHFKKINDQFGHATGDQVLVTVAQRLCTVLRSNDLVARYGGEEFAVVLHKKIFSRQSVQTIFERIHEQFRNKPIVVGKDSIELTVSIGVLFADDLTAATLNPTTLVARADKALYAAKASGRNQTVFADQ